MNDVIAAPNGATPASGSSLLDLLRRSASLLRPLGKRLALVILLSTLVAVGDGVSMGLLLPLMQSFTGVDASATSGLDVLGKLVDPLAARMGDRFGASVALIALTVLATAGISYLNRLLIGSAQWRFVYELRVRLYRQLLEVGQAFLHTQKSGGLLYAFETQCVRAGYALGSTAALFAGTATAALYMGLLLWVSVPMTLVSLGATGLVALAVRFAIDRSREAAYETNRTDAEMSVVLHEGLAAMRLVRTYGREEHELQRMARAADRTRRVYVRKFRYKDLPGPLSEAITMAGLAVALILGLRLLGPDTEAAMPALVTFLAVLFRLMPQVNGLNVHRATLAADLPQWEAVLDLLRRDDKSYVKSGTRPLGRLSQSIRFERVSFTYASRSEAALHEVCFEIPRGKVTALVGPSGAGKSTVTDLLIRLYDPDRGRILVDGCDLRELGLAQWRAAIGVVSQEGFIFNATVRENIGYGRVDASDDEIVAASRRAYADEFIRDLPRGYDTTVGERGALLSGGQRQRIAIARAILRDPQLLILDEATSALDNLSERLVQKAIEEISADRTVLVIAHRLSTIERAAQIVVLDAGRVIEIGAHPDLLAGAGLYARLYRQAAHELSSG